MRLQREAGRALPPVSRVQRAYVDALSNRAACAARAQPPVPPPLPGAGHSWGLGLTVGRMRSRLCLALMNDQSVKSALKVWRGLGVPCRRGGSQASHARQSSGGRPRYDARRPPRLSHRQSHGRYWLQPKSDYGLSWQFLMDMNSSRLKGVGSGVQAPPRRPAPQAAEDPPDPPPALPCAFAPPFADEV